MSSYNNLVQRADVYYSPMETGGVSWSRTSRRPFPKEEIALAVFLPSETERHLQRAYDLLSSLRDAVQTDR